ncbi:MAG: MG2 domain-containing protein, partial [Psychroflexus sp.]
MKNFKYLLLFFCVSFFFSCSNQNDSEDEDKEKFKTFVSQFTSGQISIADPIIIEFPQIINQYSSTQKLPQEYLEISPKIDGELKIIDGKRLVFQPEKYFQSGQKYEVELNLEKFYDDLESEFEVFEFTFETITPDFKISFKDLQSYDDQWQYLNAVVETSDLMNSEDLKKAITAEQKDKDLKIKFENEDTENTFFSFKIDSIRRHKTGSKLILSWDGSEVGAKTSGEYEYNIPGEMDFQVLEVKTSTGNNPKLSINFSERISSSQNFLGLIEIDGKNDFNFEVDGNLLNIYPKQNFSGNVELKINKNITNQKDETLTQEFSGFVTFKQLKPGVKLISEGVILPNAKENPFYFEAVNLLAVDVSIIKIYENNILDFLQDGDLNNTSAYQIKKSGRLIAKKTIPLIENKVDHDGKWTAHAIDLAKIFELDKASIYQVEISFNKAYSLYNCDESSEEKIKNFKVNTNTKTEDFGEEENNFWNNKSNRRRSYTYNWRERENPCHDAFYNDDNFISSNLLASDLGIIIKKSENGKYLFSASNILTAEPISGAEIKVFNYQKQNIATVKTGENGFAELETSEYLSFATANYQSDFAYLKIDDNQALQTSNFDVSGKSVKNGIDGFLYTERGVHRPGDDIFLTFVLNDHANPIPENYPVKLSFTDPSGRLIHEEVKNQSIGNFYAFKLQTEDNDPTGNWTANLSIGDVNFQKTLRIASVKPNRLKIKLSSTNEVLKANAVNTFQLQTQWLTGATAKNLDFEVETEIKTLQTPFEKFENYNFNSPTRSFESQELAKIEGKVDGFGKDTFYPEFNINTKAPGMLKANFLTKVFEGGGDFSIDVQSKKLSPFSHYVGLKSLKEQPNKVFDTGENLEFETISLDQSGNTAGRRQLEVKIYKINWRWWWNRGRDNLSEFEQAKKHQAYKSFEITGDQLGKATFSINIPDEDRGRYLFRITDTNSGHSTGDVYYFYSNWWRNDSGNTPSSDLI